MNPCKVSVCIPTYNCGTYIAEAIESVLTQSFSDFELVIVDNASNDQTSSIVESYAKQDPRIKFSINKVNIGMVENWNRCLTIAKGEYIKFVFADDLLASPNALAQMITLLDSDTSISLVGSSRNVINEFSQNTGIVSHFKTGIMTGTNVIIRCLLELNNFIGEPSVVMFRKKQAGRGFKTNYQQIVDLEMWFHLLEQGSFAFINEPLCSFRIHGQQQTVKNKKSHSHLKDFVYLLDDYLHKDYVLLSSFMKRYLQYDTLYGFWKLYKKNIITRNVALELINTNRSFSFFAWYPFYKLLKPFYKLFKSQLKQNNIYIPSIQHNSDSE